MELVQRYVNRDHDSIVIPNQEFHEGVRRCHDANTCLLLRKAATKGDWRAAKKCFEDDPDLVRLSITSTNNTALHIAVFQRNATFFVKNLLRRMDPVDTEMRNHESDTALCVAARSGHIHMAKLLLEKHADLLDMNGKDGKHPLYLAVVAGKHEMARYLFEKSKRMRGGHWTNVTRAGVLLESVKAEIFDLAIHIVSEHQELACTEDILGVLAQKPNAFTNRFYHCGNKAKQLLLVVWGKILELPAARVAEILRGPADANGEHPSRVPFVATKMGNHIFVKELITRRPDLALERDEKNQTIFHVVVSHRQSMIFSFLHRLGDDKHSIINSVDINGNNLLHLVGLPKESHFDINISEGPVLVLREELCWFLRIQETLHPNLGMMTNKDGHTPLTLFFNKHQEMGRRGIEGIKSLCIQISIVAILLGSATLQATFTFSGGYKQDSGLPFFSGHSEFDWASICNMGSFFLACMALLAAVEMLTSDFKSRSFSSQHLRYVLATILLSLSVVLCVSAFTLNVALLYNGLKSQIPNFALACMYVVIILSLLWVFQSLWSVSTFTLESRLKNRTSV